MNHATRVADWIREILELGRRAGLTDPSATLSLNAIRLQSDAVQVVVTGGTNAGKSSLINALLDRDLLPISALRSTVGIAIEAGESEAVLVGDQSKPLSALGSALRQPAGTTVVVVVANEWLVTNGLRLFERPPLDASDHDLDNLLTSMLAGADVVIHLVDALMPITRSDSALLAECSRRALPLVVVLWKSGQVETDERQTVRDYVQRHLESTALNVQVLDIDEERTEPLRAALAAVTATSDFSQVRLRQAQVVLLDALRRLEVSALAGLEAEQLSASERKTELERSGDRLERQGLAWSEIEQRLSSRRQKVDEQVRDHLSTSRTSVFEALCYELEKCNDVHIWWGRDLPHRLQRELRNVSGHISATLTRQIAADIRWVQEELHHRFRFPLSTPFAEPVMAVEEVGVTPPPMPLADMKKLHVVSRLGTAATVALAGLTLANAGLAGIMIAVSSLAGLAAEQLAQRRVSQDRGSVRTELDRLVQRAWLDYAVQVSERLRVGYRDLIMALKQEQEHWHESQLHALRTVASAQAVDWQRILEETHRLALAIRGEKEL